MFKVKLAAALPALFCTLEGLLWYWDLHSRPWVPSYFGGASPAILISNGLDLPATLLSTVVTLSVGGLLGWSFVHTPARLFFLTCVAGTWYLIGQRLDRRVTREKERRVVGTGTWDGALHLFALAVGAAILLFSFHLPIWNFVYIIERAFAQTWAVFLISIPWLYFVQRYQGNVEGGQAPPPLRPALRPISNLRLLILAIGAFATLLIIGVLVSR